MEGKINFYACDDISNNKPSHRGFVEIGGVVHEFAVWPAKSGKGWSGKYKPKGEKPKQHAGDDNSEASF